MYNISRPTYLGIIRSAIYTKAAPPAKPTATGRNAKDPISVSDNSIAGANRLQNDAAIIIPAAKPKLISMKQKKKA